MKTVYVYAVVSSAEDFTEGEVDRLLANFANSIDDVKEGCNVGCGVEPIPDKEINCPQCGGEGTVPKPPEKVDAISEEEMEELYGETEDSAPVAQRTEQPPPKRKVEGSNPSGSTTDKEEKEL